MAGRYDGDATIGELLVHGDLGIGTVQRLDGEAWVVDGDGRVTPVSPETRTPFAVVCRFTPVATAVLDGPLDLPALRTTLDGLAPPDVSMVAVRVTGTFTALSLRSVHAQVPPYPPLIEVTKHQTEWRVEEASGTVVGFRFPTETAGVEVPGYHLHFLSEDRTCGGHVLELTLSRGEAAVDDADELHVELPDGLHLGRAPADLDAIHEGEGGA